MKNVILLTLFILFMTQFKTYASDQIDQEISDIVASCKQQAEENKWVPRFANRESTDFLALKDGQLTIKSNLQIRYQFYFTPEELAQSVLITEEAKDFIIEYMNKYGINLQLTLEQSFYSTYNGTPHPAPANNGYVVYMRRNTGEHMKSTYWGINFGWSRHDRGMIYTHEFMHKLGLPDEYGTVLNPNVGEEDNIMNNWNAPNARLYPRQIKALLSPLCSFEN